MDPASTAATLIGVQQAKQNVQIGITVLRHQAEANQEISYAIISAVEKSLYTPTGRSITPTAQIFNGRA